MTSEEYRQAMDRLVHVAKLIAQADVEAVSQVINHAHAVGHILDPTAYRAGMRNLEQQSMIIRAIRAAQRVLQEDEALHAMLITAPAFDRFVKETLESMAANIGNGGA